MEAAAELDGIARLDLRPQGLELPFESVVIHGLPVASSRISLTRVRRHTSIAAARSSKAVPTDLKSVISPRRAPPLTR